MLLIRLTAVVFLIFTVIAVGIEVIRLTHTGHWNAIAAGQFWTNLDAGSLARVQGFVQRRLDPALWDSVIAWILHQPAWIVAGLPGISLLWLDLRKRSSKPRRKFRPTSA